MPVLERLVANITATAGAVKRRKLHGRSYLVVPTVMLTEGVHTGSNGPGLYLKNEMEKHPDSWNHKPVVVYHPDNSPTACDPDVLESQQVGILLNTKYDDKLRTESWLDEERCKEVDPRIIEAVENGETMEVSTGLYLDPVKDGTSVWNGEKYDWKATNLRPDHLAILPDKVGACSVEKGAGLLQLNEASFDKIRMFVRNALAGKFGQPGQYWDGWIEDIYSDFVVFWNEGKLWKINYSASDDGAVLNGKPAEVVRVSEYKTKDGEVVGNVSGKIYSEVEVTQVNKKQKIDKIIKNSAGVWTEDDREELNKLDDKGLDKLLKPTTNTAPKTPKSDDGADTDVEPAPAPKPVKAAKTSDPDDTDDGTDTSDKPVKNKKKGIGLEDLDPRLQAVINEGLEALNEKRDGLIETIVANKENEFSEDELKKMSTKTLNKLAKLAKVKEEVHDDRPASRFDGMGNVVVENEEDEELYTMPQMAFNTLNGKAKK